MAKIKIKHFGPIGEGVTSGDGWLYFDKVTVLIGNQATGKSSVAKLISTISWIEKAVFQKELTIKDVTTYNRFRKKHCAYQGIEGYFRDETAIYYSGDYIDFQYEEGNVEITEHTSRGYQSPKIMYVPAERNFLSVVEDPSRLKNLPLPLYTFLDEFEEAKRSTKGPLSIPVANVEFEYQKQNKISYVKGPEYRVRLKNASSGIQSLLPLYMVSRELAMTILKGEHSGAPTKSISLEQESRIRKELNKILERNNLAEEVKALMLERLSSTYRSLAFINIVEEPEQNLYPKSQMSLLFELLNFNNWTQGNKLLLTTHSPYILNYLSLAIKAQMILDEVPVNDESRLEKITTLVDNVVPASSAIDKSSVHIYELDESGTITQLETYNGIPTDENHLNQFLAETNELYDRLLEIEESLND